MSTSPVRAGCTQFPIAPRLPLTTAVALAAVGALLSVAVFAGRLAPHNPVQQHLGQRLIPPFWEPGGNARYLLGTDQLGRDILSRLIFGTRISISLGLASDACAFALGTLIGVSMGYAGRHLSTFLLRLTDVQLAFPFLVLAIVIVALFGGTFINLVVVLALWGWPGFARLARAQVLVEREKEYVMAARALGATAAWIVRHDILPNMLRPLVVLATVMLAQMIIFESALSFLGYGVPPPAPSWGRMLSDGRDYVESAWWMITFPGLALMLTVLTFNTLADYVQRRKR